MNQPKFITVYSIKSALSTGRVNELSARVFEYDSQYVFINGEFIKSMQMIGRDCFLNREEAVAAADVKRLKKIKSLTRQIEKLKQMTFE